ncbi:MAG: hypothetical protein U0350_39650 [Caldilineaceae bacterium]
MKTWLKNNPKTKILLQRLAFVLSLALVVVLPLVLIYYITDHLLGIWLGTMLFFFCLLALAGRWFTAQKSLLGILINKENRLSFARLQMVCWWVLLISAVLVVAGARYKAQTDIAQTGHWLSIIISEGLLAAAGISMGTAAVTSVINDVKRNPNPNQNQNLDEEQHKLTNQWLQEWQATALGKQHGQAPWKIQHLSVQVAAYERRNGFLKVSKAPALTDFILSNEVGNWEEMDWAKVQAILLTTILISLYSLALWRMLAAGTCVSGDECHFPDFSGALATLLAVSCAGYKGSQLANHSFVSSATPTLKVEQPTEKPGEWSLGFLDNVGNIVSYVTGNAYQIRAKDQQPPVRGAHVIFQVPERLGNYIGEFKILSNE